MIFGGGAAQNNNFPTFFELETMEFTLALILTVGNYQWRIMTSGFHYIQTMFYVCYMIVQVTIDYPPSSGPNNDLGG